MAAATVDGQRHHEAGRSPVRGRSSIPMSPCIRQPTAASHVRALTTGESSVEDGTGPSRQPVNQRADEHASSPCSQWACFLRFMSM